MRHYLPLILVLALIVGCSGPTVIAPTREPTKPAVPMIIDTETSTPSPTATYTPIADTPTLRALLTNTPTLTNTATATQKPTATQLVTKVPTRTLGPTRTPAPTHTPIPTIFLPPTDTPVPVVVQPTNPPVQVCCKVCIAGKACGDSCIAKNKTCHQPPGCACNG